MPVRSPRPVVALSFAISALGCYPDDVVAVRMTAANTAGTSNDSAGASGAAPVADDCGKLEVVRLPTCYDGLQGESETDIDCGGGECQPCTDGTCVSDADCLAGSCSDSKCAPGLELQYLAFQEQPLTAKIDNRITLTYLESSTSFDLASLSLRYYFRRNDVIEPLLIPNANATLLQSSVSVDISADTSWRIIRTARDASADFDAYLEVRFTKSYPLMPGDQLKVDQSLNAGSELKQFDQRSHYSFRTGGALARSDRITVYQNDQLVWGYEPRGGGAASCFFQGINFGGPGLLIGADSWSAEPATLSSTGSKFDGAALLYPELVGAESLLVQTGYRLAAGDTISVPAADGDYLAYIYAFSASNFELGTLRLQGALVDQFQAGESSGGQIWSRLGPYPVRASRTRIELGCSAGSLALSGLELRRPASARY